MNHYAYGPSGGRLKMWMAGVGVALIPIVYGIRCLAQGEARLFGRGANLDLTGHPAVALSIAYLAVGAFIHFHYFWGLHPRLYPFSLLLKLLAVLVFLGGFGSAVYLIML